MPKPTVFPHFLAQDLLRYAEHCSNTPEYRRSVGVGDEEFARLKSSAKRARSILASLNHKPANHEK